MDRLRFSRYLLPVAVALLVGCAAATPPRVGPEPCTGSLVLVVHNNTGGSVDIHRNVVGRPFVGTAGPGTSRLSLAPNEQGGTYLAFTAPRPGQDATYVGTGTRTADNRLQILEQCLD